MPITSPVERISGPRIGSVPANLLNGNTASFTDTNGGMISSVKPMSSSVSPHITRAACDASGTPIALDTNGIVRLARGFTSSTYTTPSLDRELHVDQPDDAERLRHRDGLLAHRLQVLLADQVRRQHARRVAGVDAGVLDVLHDAADHHVASPSESASTSTSYASSRKRSISTGRSSDTRAARREVVLERRRDRRRSASRARRARSSDARAPDSRSAPPPRAPPRRSSPCRSAAA